MLSERKLLLRVAEFLCIGAAALCLGAACFAKLKPARAASVEGLFYWAFVGVIGLALVAALLLNEFSREVEYRRASRPGPDTFTTSLFRFVLRWAPAPHKHAALFGILVLMLTPVVLGSGSWASNEPFEPGHAVGFLTLFCGIFLGLLPVFAAANRMPGVFEDHASIFSNDG